MVTENRCDATQLACRTRVFWPCTRPKCVKVLSDPSDAFSSSLESETRLFERILWWQYKILLSRKQKEGGQVFVFWLYYVVLYVLKNTLPKKQLLPTRTGLLSANLWANKPQMPGKSRYDIFSDFFLLLISHELVRIIYLCFISIPAKLTELWVNRSQGSKFAQNGKFLVRALGTAIGCNSELQSITDHTCFSTKSWSIHDFGGSFWSHDPLDLSKTYMVRCKPWFLVQGSHKWI
jgi:hypothetical protein